MASFSYKLLFSIPTTVNELRLLLEEKLSKIYDF